jgi:hypothetical protein
VGIKISIKVTHVPGGILRRFVVINQEVLYATSRVVFSAAARRVMGCGANFSEPGIER